MSARDRYLRELHQALPLGRRRRIVVEIRHHFDVALTDEMARGLSEDEAEALIIARLGPPASLAEQFATDEPAGVLGRAGGGLMLGRKRRAIVLLATATIAVLGVFAFVHARRTDPAGSKLGQAAAEAALTQIGTPYSWGGDSPSSGFDASGLVVWAYAKAGGPVLPHYPAALWRLGRHVSKRQLVAGDLVFFFGHANVGIYVGNSRFIDAAHTGSPVRIETLTEAVYRNSYSGAVRI